MAVLVGILERHLIAGCRKEKHPSVTTGVWEVFESFNINN
jgi:hypothetical protein